MLRHLHISKFTILLTFVWLAAPAGVSAYEGFDRPEELKPDIAFWTRVFGEITSDQALLHDSRHLEVVYEVIEIPEDASHQRRRRIADLTRERYKKILQKLASGKRTGLNGEELRVLALWPDDVSNEELREATKRIRFQQGLSDRFLAGLKRSGAWKPYIEQRLAAAGVPTELSALPHVESSFNPDARSHVGAAGLWQFTRSTGQRFMQIDHVVDERRDPFRSSDAAAELLAYNYSILQSWPLAITAYNHGVAGMRRAASKLGTKDMGTINREYTGRTFGFASRNFYVAFLAALDVERDYESYFGEVVMDEPSVDLLIESPGYVPAASFAAALGISEKQLRKHNPALLEPIWDGTKYVPRNFQVRLPAALADVTEDEVLAAIPQGQRFAQQTPDMYHKVRRGESLSVIAARYNTSTRELVSLNGLRSKHRIRAGQTLRLPYAGVSIPEGAETYTVRKGDSLSKIAKSAGVSQSTLMAMNKLTNKNRIYVGQVLYLLPPEPEAQPASSGVAVAAVTAEPAEPVSVASAPVVEESVPAESEVQMPEPLIPEPLIVAEADVEEESVSELEAAAAATASLADPNDYRVAADNTIEVQASETLGHFADWLDIKTQRLRDINKLSFSSPVVVGQRIKLDFDRVGSNEFETRRIAYHREMQEAFFVRYRVTDTTEHKLRSGESVWVLTHRRYKVPEWLVRQYNPDLDFARVPPGTRIVFPLIEPIEREARLRQTVAEAQ